MTQPKPPSSRASSHLSNLSGSAISAAPSSTRSQQPYNPQEPNVFERLSTHSPSSVASRSSENYFNTLNPIRTETDIRKNRHVPPHKIKPKEIHAEYFDTFVKPKRLKMSRTLNDAVYSRMFSESALSHIFKWLKLECTPEERNRFHQLMKKIHSYNPPKKDTVMQYSVDESFNMVSLYATKTFTDEEALRVAAWLRNKATEQEKDEFKTLLSAFKAYRSLSIGSFSTQTEEFPVIPSYIPDKLESKSINDVASKRHRAKYKPIHDDHERKEKIQKLIGKKMNYKSTYQDTFAGRQQSSWSLSKKPGEGRVPYGVLNGHSLKSSNRAHYQYWGRAQREAPASNENRVTASIGNTIPSFTETVDDETLDRITRENEEAMRAVEGKSSALQESSGANLDIYISENKRSFGPQKMYRESDRRAYDNARNQQRKTPYAQTVTGYALKSMVTSTMKDNFNAKKEPWMEKVRESNYNRKKLPSYLRPA